jgi:KRAB domain-containing zinc finger protein
LHEHVRSVHDKIRDHKCAMCDYSASRQRTLKEQLKSVHDKIKDYKCNQCCYSSSYSSSLKNHVGTVHGDVKHKCALCDYMGKSKGTKQPL